MRCQAQANLSHLLKVQFCLYGLTVTLPISVKTKFQELQESQGKPDKRYADLETQFNTVKQEKDQYKSKLDEVVGQFDQFKAQKDKSGNFVPSKQKAGSFADALELMDMLAEANGLKKKNNAKEPERRTPPPPTTLS